jgi:flavorubredoxin
MQTGVVPSAIMALVYQNYNPRLCSSLPHLEMIINRDDLKIVSHHANHMFIQHYSESAKLVSLEDINFQLTFSSGRQLEFINTPFAHSAGSLVTFDPNSGILFTGDLFSSYSSEWDLLLRLDPKCRTCRNYPECPDGRKYCQIFDTLKFHQNIMTSERALKYALDRIATVPFTVVAPQHGSVIDDIEDILALCEMLSSLKGVGIDGVIGDKSFFELGDTSPIRERLYKANGLS